MRNNEKCQIMSNEIWKILCFFLLNAILAFGGIVPFARANLSFIRRALNFHADSAKLPIACFISWIVTQTVLRSDLCCYPRKSCPCVVQGCRQKSSAATTFGHFVHFTTCEVVEVAADLHLFKWPHLAKIHKVFRLSTWKENLPVALQLLRGKRQTSIVLAIFH